MQMREDQEQLVGHLMRVATIVAMQEKLEPGYRIVINDGPDAREWYLCSLMYRTDCVPSSHPCNWRKEVRLASSLFISSRWVFVYNTRGTKELLCTDLPRVLSIGEIKSAIFERRKRMRRRNHS